MAEKKLLVKIDEVKEKLVHGGRVRAKILIDEETTGAKNFSFLVNTMEAGLNCNYTGEGHSHDVEHCLYVLSGRGGISVDGKIYNLEPGCAVFIPKGAMHYVFADVVEDLKYIIIYSPPGPEKEI